ncbi:MAG: YdcF family protein [Rhodobacteraceae bacterium]|nr:YdcF family protein [Paracoccaceae bacterium]
MTLLRKIRFVLSFAVLTYLLTLAFVMGFAALQPAFEPDRFEKADVIVVLGAGMDADGTLHKSSLLRVEKGVALFKAGAAKRMHFTGGVGGPRGPSAGQQMARHAQSFGVQAEQTTAEGASYSTLQNALFSQRYLLKANRIILVTEGFHLPRSWASFKYFGDYDVALARSVAFRKTSPNANWPWLTMCLREALAIWFNAGRLVVWETAGVLSIDDKSRNEILY